MGGDYIQLNSSELDKRGCQDISCGTRRAGETASEEQSNFWKRTDSLDGQRGAKNEGTGFSNSGWHRIREAREDFSCDSNAPGGQTWTKTFQIGGRLQRSQQWNARQTIQDGNTENSTQDGKKRLLDVQLGLEFGISPFFDQSKQQEMAGIQVEGRVADLQCPSIWTEHQSLVVHKINENSASTLEEARNHGDWLHRRFSTDGINQREVTGMERDHRTGYESSGSYQRGEQRSLGANSESGIPWIDTGYRKCTCENPTGQVDDFEGIVASCDPKFNSVSQNNGQDSWKDYLPISSIQSSSYLHKGTLQTSGCSQQNEMGMESSIAIDSTSKKRCTMATGQSGSIQWKECLETISCASAEYRCINDRLGSNSESRREGWRQLDYKLGDERNEPTHIKEGIDGSVSWIENFPERVAREVSDTTSGQSKCAELHGEWGRKTTGYGSTSQEDLELDSSLGHFNLQDRVAFIRREPYCRSGEQNYRSQRLDSSCNSFSENKSTVGTIFNRQVCISPEPQDTTFQFMETMPRNRSSGLLHTRLEGREQFRGSTIEFDSQSDQSHSGNKSFWSTHSTSVGESSMVATIDGNYDKLYQTSSSRVCFPARPITASGTMVEQEVGLPSSAISRIAPFKLHKQKVPKKRISKDMSGAFPLATVQSNAQSLVDDSRAESTKKRYKSDWEYFKQWCEWTNSTDFPCSVVTILNFASWYEMTGRGASVGKVLAAISSVHEDQGLPNPVKDSRVQKLVKGATRRASEDKEFVPERDPLPLSALKYWIEHRPTNISYKVWKRNTAMLALGLRCMRRPIELTWLRVRDVIGWRQGMLWIRIPKSKTDQFGRGKCIPIDPVRGSVCCPATIIWNYWKERKQVAARGDFLFTSYFGRPMSSATVSSIVRKAANHAKLQGRYTGHSLRIGGVTAAVTGGLTMAQLRGIGDWESTAVRFYLRALSAASIHASSKMGF